MSSKLPSHLFIADNGNLYDTRISNWSHCEPLRKEYRYTFHKINSVAKLKAVLRNGQYAWPGGYPMAIVLSDGGVISFATALSEFRYLVDALRDYRTNKYKNSGWRPIGCEILYDGEFYDCHTGDKLETAYDSVDDQ